jgi:lipoprotein-anchoring transpeptidase ErfK/SrfK
MYHKQLVEHIINKKAEWVSHEDIRKELLKDGWSKEDIDLAFSYAEHPETMKQFSFKRILRGEVRAVYFVITILTTATLAVLPFVQSQAEIASYTINGIDIPAVNKPVFVYGAQPAMSSPDFFNTVKNKFIEQKATFVEVDLTTMVAKVYTDGIPTVEVSVKTKGKNGSWWETPAGLYKIETKEKTHYSSMGHVTQPWSMQFQGNFFIHGWPYYDDGTPVASTFSGGCIRLADENAKKIFDAVKVGTPILVYEKDFSPDAFTYTEVKPDIQGTSFFFADINNNFVFLKQSESLSVPLGTITKLMTALIATEYINIEKPVTVPSSALVDTSTPRLSAGMKTEIYQLLFPLLRESSNEAGEAIALSYGRGLFIKHMNEKAKAIGMTHTKFVDPTGVSQNNVSTAEDMFMLAKYIYNNRSFIFNITSGKVKTTTYGESVFTRLGNSNSMSSEKNFFGGIGDEGKGSNESNLSVLEMTTPQGVRPLFVLTLGSANAKKDIVRGVEYLMGRWR